MGILSIYWVSFSKQTGTLSSLGPKRLFLPHTHLLGPGVYRIMALNALSMLTHPHQPSPHMAHPVVYVSLIIPSLPLKLPVFETLLGFSQSVNIPQNNLKQEVSLWNK